MTMQNHVNKFESLYSLLTDSSSKLFECKNYTSQGSKDPFYSKSPHSSVVINPQVENPLFEYLCKVETEYSNPI